MNRLRIAAGTMGPAFDSSPGCGRATDGDDAAGRVFSAPAPEGVSARARIEQLKRELGKAKLEARALKRQVRWWQDVAAEPTAERGAVLRTSEVAGEIEHTKRVETARDLGASEARERAAVRLLCHVMADPLAVKSPAWSEAARELIRSMEGRDRG
jgi:hypothetical protein